MAKARKLLAAKAVPDKQQKIYDRNATTSPLLRLPPEIRNRIWDNVLGGRNIHVWASKSTGQAQVHHSICQLLTAEESAEGHEVDVGGSTVKYVRRGYELDKHRRYHGKVCDLGEARSGANQIKVAELPQRHLQLAVLQTCRMVHQEAALLPFVSNTFTFMDDPAVFLDTLLQPQARAIKAIVLLRHSIYGSDSKKCMRLVADKLCGLRSFVCVWHTIHHFLGEALEDFETRLQRACSDRMLMFADSPLEHVKVAMTLASHTRDDRFLDVARTWRVEMEQRLLAPVGGQTYAEYRKERAAADRETELQEKKQRREGRNLRPLKD